MANYKAGNIYIDIQAQQQKAVDGIKKTITQLRILKDVIKSTRNVNQTINKTANVAVKSQSEVQKQLKKTNEVTKQLESNSKKASNNFDKMFSFGKMYVFLNYAKRVAQVFIDIVSSAINFNETLNKFEVAMGENYERALGFVNSLTKAFNLSTQSIMDYQATFMNMLSALEGLNEDTSYMLSETLTRMGVDFSSLFNVSIDRAMSMFQSALSGQVRAIRSISGYDITQSTYYALYQSMGGEKSVRQLTMIEKRLLVILAIQKQMEKTGAIGDFEKTINYSANQLKQLRETFKEITMYIGQFALYYIKPFVEKLLGFAIAIREVLSSAYDKATNKVVEKNVEGVTNKFEKANQEIEDLTDNAESAKKSLLGFDKINTLGSSSNSGIGSDVEMIINELGKYQSSLENVKSKAQEISVEILSWLGYTRNENGELEKTGSRLSNILAVIELVGMALGGALIWGSIKNIKNSLGGIGTAIGSITSHFSASTMSLGFANAKLLVISGIVAGIVALFATLYTTNEDFRKSVDELVKSLGTILKPIIEFIADVVKGLMPIITMILDLLATILVPILDLLTPILTTIGVVLEGILGSLSESLQMISEIVVALLQGDFSKIADIFEEKVSAMGEIWKNFGKKFLETWKNFGKNIKEWWQGIADFFKPILENWKNIFIDVFDYIVEGIKLKIEWIVNGVIDSINKIIKGINKVTGVFGIGEIKEIGYIDIADNTIDTNTYEKASSQSDTNAYDEMINMLGGITMPVTNALLEAINDNTKAVKDGSHPTIEINGRKMAEATYEDYQAVATRKGVKNSIA